MYRRKEFVTCIIGTAISASGMTATSALASHYCTIVRPESHNERLQAAGKL